jgi:predicted dehydrogenase
MDNPVVVGIVGAGAISASYLKHLSEYPDIRVAIVGDIDAERARARADEFEVPSSGSTQDVLDHPDVEIVVNLTIPAVHAEISSLALDAGKNVWSEKPIGVSRAEASALVAKASASGLRLGVAPDTLLGPGMQTVRRLIAQGVIGEPLGAVTMMQTAGPQRGHPNPEFLFQPGAGPLFDFGPYYFSALATLFGSFSRVAAFGARAYETRVIGSGPRAGTVFPVEVPTNVAVSAEFVSGQLSQSTLSFDAQIHRMGFFEVYGTEGTLSITDPNAFTGRIALTRAPAPGPIVPDQEIEWEAIAAEGPVTGRGLGVLDMARSIRAGRPHIASAELGAHVLDTLVAVEESIASGAAVTVGSRIAPVGTLEADFNPFEPTL